MRLDPSPLLSVSRRIDLIGRDARRRLVFDFLRQDQIQKNRQESRYCGGV